jgi:hypothetical protein
VWLLGFVSLVWAYRNIESLEKELHRENGPNAPLNRSSSLFQRVIQRLPVPLSSYLSFHRGNLDAIHTLGQRAFAQGHYYDAITVFQHLVEANTTAVPTHIMATSSYGLIRSFIALHQLKPARKWTDWYSYGHI